MRILRVMVCVLGLVSWSGAAAAETKEKCVSGNCEYDFDDADVNSPGHSAYGDWFKINPPAKRVMLIRPRISFVMELLKSSDGV